MVIAWLKWSIVLLSQDPFTPDDGWFDALALAPAADPVFRLDFVWLGPGTPGSQPFVFYDAGFDITASGMTAPSIPVPSPGSGGLLLAGLCPALRFTQRRETRS